MRYCICWRSPVNGEVQRGRPLFASVQVAEDVAKMMNTLWPDTEHWAEAAGEAAETPTAGARETVRV